jgi:isocitrate/isopropylmalate dehydrogenase
VSRRRVVVIEGEDAAPEAVRPSLAVLRRLAPDVEWVHPVVGRTALDRGLPPFPDEARAAIDAADATLFGATSGASAPALFYLRWGKATYANVRPVRYRPGARSPLARPEGIDLVIVRENLEDLYLGVEGELAALAPLGLVSPMARRPVADLAPGRFALKVITEAGTERVARFAFALAQRRRRGTGRGRVTCATKHNMLRQSDGLFRAVVERVGAAFPEVPLEVQIVDDFARRLVAEPHSLDVVVLPNLYGDILSDAAAALVGGLGLAPSGCYGDGYAYFEPAHGTAPDLAGKGTINPTATLLSGAMLLEHLGLTVEAARLEAAVDRVYAEGKALTPDQGGSAGTDAFCEAVLRTLEG